MKLPLGYRYAATYAGIRKENKDDLALIVSDAPASAAALFHHQPRAGRAGSAGAQASRGIARQGERDSGRTRETPTAPRAPAIAAALACCRAVARELKVPVEQVLPASTGVIGVELDPALITKALPGAGETPFAKPLPRGVAGHPDHGPASPRSLAARFRSAAGPIHIAGMTKGSGMIHPNMATTLGFVMTDAAIAPAFLEEMLDRAQPSAATTGFRSTAILRPTTRCSSWPTAPAGIKLDLKERLVFQEVLCWVLEDLAEMIARDGEGARKLITIHVVGAPSQNAAARIARAIANSPLVKTAIAGATPTGAASFPRPETRVCRSIPAKVDIFLQRVQVCRRGVAANFSERELKQKLDTHECLIRFVLNGGGHAETRFWTCDLTHGYIDINASYRT